MRRGNILKKVISIIVSIVLVLMISPFAVYSADYPNDGNIRFTRYVAADEGFRLVAISSEDKLASIVEDSLSGFVEVVIKYVSNPDKLYRWVFTDTAEFGNIDYYSSCSALIDYAEGKNMTAEVIDLCIQEDNDTVCQKPVRDGDQYILKQDLAALVGSNGYNGTLRYSDSRGGVNFHVYETLGLYISQLPNATWGGTLTLGSIIVTVLGLATGTEVITKLATILGVAASAASLVPPGGLKRYNCMALDTRYVTADGSSHLFTSTDKQITYTGFSNANDASRPYIVNATHQTVYSDSSVYFYSYPSQIDTAYSVYLQIGL